MGIDKNSMTRLDFSGRNEVYYMYSEKDIELLIAKDIEKRMEKIESCLVNNLRYDHTSINFRIDNRELYANVKLVFTKEGTINGKAKEGQDSVRLHEVQDKNFGESLFQRDVRLGKANKECE